MTKEERLVELTNAQIERVSSFSEQERWEVYSLTGAFSFELAHHTMRVGDAVVRNLYEAMELFHELNPKQCPTTNQTP
jgi:hypothetical protein